MRVHEQGDDAPRRDQLVMLERCKGPSPAKELQCCRLEGDMIRLVAVDLVRGFLLARMVDVSFVVHILGAR
jgi:hypothetical protein